MVAEATELQINLPYEFSIEDYVQIVTDFANRIAPRTGLAAAGYGPTALNRSAMNCRPGRSILNLPEYFPGSVSMVIFQVSIMSTSKFRFCGFTNLL